MVFRWVAGRLEKNAPNFQPFGRSLVNINLVSVALKPGTSEGWLVAFL